MIRARSVVWYGGMIRLCVPGTNSPQPSDLLSLMDQFKKLYHEYCKSYYVEPNDLLLGEIYK